MKTRPSFASKRLHEALAPRKLLSAAWSTVDTYLSRGGFGTGMAADSAGNVYMSGTDQPATGPSVAIVLEKASGSTTWTTILQTPSIGGSQEPNELGIDAAGDLFLGGAAPDGSGFDGVVREKPAGQSTFSIINKTPGVTIDGLATDAAGDVYAIDGSVICKLVPGPNGFTATNVYQAPGWFKALAIGALQCDHRDRQRRFCGRLRCRSEQQRQLDRAQRRQRRNNLVAGRSVPLRSG